MRNSPCATHAPLLKNLFVFVITYTHLTIGRYEWLVWMDLDAIFVRSDLSLRDVLDPAFDLHVTEDFGRSDRVNTGFFAIKATPWSYSFLEQVGDRCSSDLWQAHSHERCAQTNSVSRYGVTTTLARASLTRHQSTAVFPN